MKIGAHVPTLTGYKKMFEYAHEVNCECLQFFTKAPVVWEGKPISHERINQFDQAHRTFDCMPCLIHGSYLINLISDKPRSWERAVSGLAHEISRAAQLGVRDLNIHTGSSRLRTKEESAVMIAQRIQEARGLACEEVGPIANNVRIVLENTAGSGSTYGTTIQELAAIISAAGASEKEMGICIDTCHAWAAGYAIDTDTGWNQLIDEVDQTCGLTYLQWIHANDSVYGCGSRKDRHAWIGQGTIGLHGFEVMCQHPRLEHVCVVVEMPGSMPIKDRRNIELLQAMRDGKSYAHLKAISQESTAPRKS